MVEVGKKYNRLTVVEMEGFNKWGQRLWRCRCDCGAVKVVSTSSLTSGNTKSCGCWQKERMSVITRLGKEGARRNSAISRAIRDNFQWRKLLFDLDVNEQERKVCERLRKAIIRIGEEAKRQQS